VRILFLSQRVPYPPNRGDKITTWRLIERMRRKHDVRVVAFAHGAEDVAAAEQLDAERIPTTPIRYAKNRALAGSWPALLRGDPITLHAYGSRELQRAVDREVARGVDLAYAYSSSMGAFLLPHAGLKWVMHFAELDSDKWRQYAAVKRWPASWIYGREARLLLAFEQRLAAVSRQNVFCTGLEEAIFREQIPGRASCVLRNGVDLAHFRPAPDQAEPGHIVFTGVMDYYPNVDACEFFARDVLPLVRARHPDARFSIVGSQPTQKVQALASLPGVTVTGFVPDTRDWLARAALSVAPLRIARGIQNKVLEACAMGLPVVGSTPATQGVEWKPLAGTTAPFRIADGRDATVEAVLALLNDRAAAARLGALARAFVEAHYDWDTCLDALEPLLESCAGAPAPSRQLR
jgi:sugar transferase (PEP-CTERM/EpsH1 system associated)